MINSIQKSPPRRAGSTITQYIDKAAVIAEIKKRFDEYSSSILKHYDACKEAKAQELGKILTILDTLETKEVDLEKEFDTYCDCAKHFFEKTKTGGQAMKVNYQWHNAPKELPDSDCVCLTYYNGRYHINIWNTYYKEWDDSEGDYCEFENTEKLDWMVLEVEGGNQ